MTERRHTVTTGDGVDLAIWDSGPKDAPAVLLVHGFPDDHRAWDAVTVGLIATHRVVRLDTRGSGASSRPAGRRAYHVKHLADDLRTVIDELHLGRVHLVGHDWGSIQAWHLTLTHPGVVASLTSISGPSLDHLTSWAARCLRRGPSGWRALLSAWKSPIYMTALQLPVLAEAACRVGLVDLTVRLATFTERRGSPATTTTSARNNAAAVRIYAANLLPHLLHPRPRTTDVPVQVLAPRRDLFVPAATQSDIYPVASTSRVVSVPGGHWAPVHHGPEIAGHIADWIRTTSPTPLQATALR